MWEHPSREMIETPWSSSLNFLQLSLLLLTPDPSPGKADGNQRASSPTNSLASIPEIPQWPCTCVGGPRCSGYCTCLASDPLPPIVTVANSSCGEGKPRAADQSTSLRPGLSEREVATRGLVDFLPAGPFANHNSICRVPNLWLSHRRLCGSAKTSAEHFNYRQNDRMETLFFAGLSQTCPELMSSCNPAFRKESGVSSD